MTIQQIPRIAVFTEPQTRFEIAIHFPQGARRLGTKGGSAGKSFSIYINFKVELQYAPINGVEQPWITLPGINVFGIWKDGFTLREIYQGTAGTIPVSPETGIPTTKEACYDITKAFSVRVTRVTSQLVDQQEIEEEEERSEVRFYYTSILQSITGYKANTKPVTDPPGTKLAKTALSILATKQLNGQIDGINAIVHTHCLDWDSATNNWVLRDTNNPASLFLYILTHPANPQQLKYTNSITELSNIIDLEKIKYWHNYCNQTRTIIMGPENNKVSKTYKFQYNNVHSQVRSVLDVLRDVCAAGRASPAILDGKWTVNIDEPKSITQHFTPHNSWGFESTKALPRIPDGLKIKFYNEEKNYKEDEMIVYNYGYGAEDKYVNGVRTVKGAELFESIPLPGITSPAQIQDHAQWHFAQIQLRPEIYTLNTDIEYLVCNRGDRVKVTHDVPMWGSGSGRIKNIYQTSGQPTIGLIELDEDIYIESSSSKEYTIRIRASNGSSIETKLVKQYNILSWSYLSTVVSLKLPTQNHGISVGDNIIVTAAGVINTTEATPGIVTSISGDTIRYTKSGLAGSGFGSGGSFIRSSGYYNTVFLSKKSTSENGTITYGSLGINDIAVQDLFLFGDLNRESNDLVVLSVEPTGGTKSARLTLMDYGVVTTGSNPYNIFLDYKNNSIANFDSLITGSASGSNESVKYYSFGTAVPYVDQSKIISDFRAMEQVSAGVYSHGIIVPFEPPITEALPAIADLVEAEYVYYWSTYDIGTKVSPVPVKSGSIKIKGVDQGHTYKIRLRYLSSAGVHGLWTPWYVHQVVGKLIGPETVSNFTHIKKETGIDFLWNSCTSPDYSSTIIKVLPDSLKVSNITTNWNNSQAEVIFDGNANNYFWNRPDSGNYLVMIRHKDRSNNYSSVISNIEVNYTKVSFDIVRIELTNENHQIPINELTKTPILALSGTDIYVYESNNILKYDGLGLQNGRWRITSKTDTNVTSSPIQGVLNTQTGDNYARIGNITYISPTEDLGNTQFLIEGKNSLGQLFSIIKTQYFTKQSAGLNPVVYAIESNTPVVYKASPDYKTPGKFSKISVKGVRVEGDNAPVPFGWLGATPYTLNSSGIEVAGTEEFQYNQIVDYSIPDTNEAFKWVIKLYDTVPGSTTTPPERSTTVLDTEEIQVVLEGESYYLEIESTKGTIFRPGQSSTTMLKAKVFKNGIEVTNDTPASWFTWRRVSQNTTADAVWNTAYQSGYKQIEVTVDDVNARATFFCDIIAP